MASIPSPTPPGAAPAAPKVKGLNTNEAKVRRIGWILLVLVFGGFMAWAGLAPLDQGVAAPGTVQVSGNRKTVQPLAGGLLSAILVREGDKVRAGQVVIELDATQARSELEIARGQLYSLRATEARLLAEQVGAKSVDFPQLLREAESDARAARAMSLQRQLFETRRANLASELGAMREGIAGQQAQAEGLERSRAAKQQQVELLQEEIRGQRDLVEEGFLPRNRLSEQQRLLAQLGAAIAEDVGNIGRLRNGIAETRLRIAQRQQEFRREVETELSQVQREVTALVDRIRALEFVASNTQIRAPADGIVVGLSVFTVGGVVQAGQPLMDVVPENEPLKVDAQISPDLIDRVSPGLPVDLMFTAMNQSNTPHIPGVVLQVGADVLMDQRSELPYYKAQVEVTPEGMQLLKDYRIIPGMQVSVFVRTGERTLLNYLIKPLTDRMQSALTER